MGYLLGGAIGLLFLVYGYLNFILWRKSKSLPLLIVQGLVYLYTFHAYLLVYLGTKFSYVYHKIERFYGYPYYPGFDSYFYLSLFYHLIFAVVFFGVLYILCCKIWKFGEEDLDKEKYVDFRWIVVVCSVIIIVNLFLWRNEFLGFLFNGDISYVLFKGAGGLYWWYVFSKLSLDLASMILFFSILVMFKMYNNFRARNIRANNYLFTVVFLLIGVLFLFSLSVGDRLSLAIGVFFAFSLLRVDSGKRNKLLKIVMLLFVIFLIINVIRVIRTDEANKSLGDSVFERFAGYFVDLFSAGESHSTFSLNEVMKENVESFQGGSLKHALFIFIPHFFVKERPLDGYSYFTKHSDVEEGSGFGFHYNADWYMNLEVLGILIGAILLGTIFGGVYWFSLKSEKWRFVFAGMISIFALFMRSGMSGYKNLVYYGILGLLVYFVVFGKFRFRDLRR